MTPDGLNAELRRRPFLPFRLVMTDGKTYDIRHPDLLWVQLLEAFVGTGTISDADRWERPDILDVMHITRIEPLPSTLPPQSPESNGPKQG